MDQNLDILQQRGKETFQAEETTCMYRCLKVHDVFEELEDTKLYNVKYDGEKQQMWLKYAITHTMY